MIWTLASRTKLSTVFVLAATLMLVGMIATPASAATLTGTGSPPVDGEPNAMLNLVAGGPSNGTNCSGVTEASWEGDYDAEYSVTNGTTETYEGAVVVTFSYMNPTPLTPSYSVGPGGTYTGPDCATLGAIQLDSASVDGVSPEGDVIHCDFDGSYSRSPGGATAIDLAGICTINGISSDAGTTQNHDGTLVRCVSPIIPPACLIEDSFVASDS